MIEQVEEYDTDEFFEDESEFLEHYEFDNFVKPCPGCFGTGLDRELDSDCLTCWGDGVV